MHLRLLALAGGIAVWSMPVNAQAQGAQPSIAGMYRLVTVDGHAIPFRPVHPDAPPNAGPGPEVLASTMIVRPDGSFVMAMSYRMTRDGTQTYTAMPFTGAWKAEGDVYAARWDGAGMTPLTLSGDTLVMNNEGMMFAYLRASPRR